MFSSVKGSERGSTSDDPPVIPVRPIRPVSPIKPRPRKANIYDSLDIKEPQQPVKLDTVNRSLNTDDSTTPIRQTTTPVQTIDEHENLYEQIDIEKESTSI